MRAARVLYPRHLLLLLLPLLAGCVTTQDRFTRAFEAEQEGDLYAAARAYAEVLRRDPDFRDARRRFEATATDAADTLYARAEREGGRARYEAAVATLDDLQALRVLAGEFGVLLTLPDGHDALYAEMSEQAVRALLDRAEALAAERRYDAADERYERAYRYEMPAALRDRLDRRRAETLLDAAADALDRGRFREAVDRAERVRTFDPRPAAALLARAEQVQRVALDAGTEYVAFLPLLPTETARTVPAYWTEAVSRLLTDVYWAAPPLFVEAVPARDIRRELGRMGQRRPFSRAEAVGLARAVEATLIWVPELRTYAREEHDRRERRVAIQTRDGQDTTYTDVRATLRLSAEATFRLIEPTTRNVLAEVRVPARVERALHYATYPGDPTTLKMPSSSVRDLLDEAERRQVERDLDGELQEALARALAEAAFEHVLRQVP